MMTREEIMDEELKECRNCLYYAFEGNEEHCGKCVESVNQKEIDGFNGFWKPIFACDEKEEDN